MSSSDFVRHDDPDAEPVSADHLCPEDARALDLVLERVCAGGSATPPACPRENRLVGLLSLLDAFTIGDEARETLVQATLARVAIARHAGVVHAEDEPALVPDDEDALEALVSASFRLEHVPAGMRDRAARHLKLFSLLDTPVGDHQGTVVERTLAGVEASIAGQATTRVHAGRSRVGAERPRIFSLIRSRELVSIAAMLLIAGAMLTPLMKYAGDYSRRISCAGGMATAGIAMGQYAQANRDRLPMASACTPGNLFWNVGKDREQSNSANLFLLRVLQFSSAEELSCAGHANAERGTLPAGAWDWPSIERVSYSYQNMFAKERPAWNSGTRAVVLVDASPVIRRAVRHEIIYPFENSANHERQGQNVLWNDGSTQWLTSPVLDCKDNLWLPRPIEDIIASMQRPHEASPLRGTESPSAADDAFVGP